MAVIDPRGPIVDALIAKLGAAGLAVYDGETAPGVDRTKPWVIVELPGGGGEIPTLCPGAMWTLRARTRMVACDPDPRGGSGFTSARQACSWAASKVVGVLLDPTATVTASGWRVEARTLDADSGVHREGDTLNYLLDWSLMVVDA